MKRFVVVGSLLLTPPLYAMNQRHKVGTIRTSQSAQESAIEQYVQQAELEQKRLTELGAQAKTLKNVRFHYSALDFQMTPQKLSCCNQQLDSCSEWETTMPEYPDAMVHCTISIHAFNKWNSITEIDLSDNRLRYLPLHTIITKYCNNLETLRAAYNQITYIESNNPLDKSEKSASVLKEIDLTGNKIAEGNQIIKVVKYHTTLTRLNVGNNSFKFVPTDLLNLGKYFEDLHTQKHAANDTSACVYPKRESPREPKYTKETETLLTTTYSFVTDCAGNRLSLTL